jgi:hypothetical protein
MLRSCYTNGSSFYRTKCAVDNLEKTIQAQNGELEGNKGIPRDDEWIFYTAGEDGIE